MSVQDLKTTISNLDEADFFDLFGWVCGDEYDRRKAAPAVEKAQADLVTELQGAGKLDKPKAVTIEEAIAAPDKVPAWENPLTDHSKMYGKTNVITQQVRPTTPEENTASPGAIPFAPELPVGKSDLVEYEGVVYKVLSSHVTKSYWPPNEATSLFERV